MASYGLLATFRRKKALGVFGSSVVKVGEPFDQDWPDSSRTISLGRLCVSKRRLSQALRKETDDLPTYHAILICALFVTCLAFYGALWRTREEYRKYIERHERIKALRQQLKLLNRLICLVLRSLGDVVLLQDKPLRERPFYARHGAHPPAELTHFFLFWSGGCVRKSYSIL